MIHRLSIPSLLLSLVSLALGHVTLSAAELTLTAPLEHQVVQRSSPGKGLLRIAGELSEKVSGKDVAIEARLVGEKEATGWQRAGGSISGKKLSGTVEAPAGGWWSLEVRVTREGKELAAGRVGKVGGKRGRRETGSGNGVGERNSLADFTRPSPPRERGSRGLFRVDR
jgi:hypothetical protein